ncbi:unnamed protein product, partial [marine sediment metagenome]
RERSIAVRKGESKVPADLNDPARIRQGSGNYNSMCTGCHLSPGAEETELSLGLYPKPPNLTKEPVDAAEAFWVIKHGIKASGMPAWGKSMNDVYIWNMVAFLQELPKLDKAKYDALVASSGGHSHGGGETGGHSHAGSDEDHHEEAGHDHQNEDSGDHNDLRHEEMQAESENDATTHTHADGKQHTHAPAPTDKPAAKPQPGKPADDSHDHQH